MRALPAEVETALASGSVITRTLVRMDVESGSTGLWDGTEDLVYGGITYYGAAQRFLVEPYKAVGDLSVPGVRITFSPADAELVPLIMDEQWHQRPIYIYLAFAPENFTNWNVVQWFSGFMDSVDFNDKPGEDGAVILHCETGSRDLDLQGHHVRSDNDQQSIFAGDKFFEHVAQSVAVKINWGVKGKQNP